ncbi:trypsin-like peptidase domain-containing protein [Propioniciclava sp.]|uniref:S1C family serine protease n=1 Tax=Propioniciclava sp. TaxID=2038686 RepID=UPI002612B467|nr:trypsin-like peptidase domain-containing protein [Propioniciclava sp.]
MTTQTPWPTYPSTAFAPGPVPPQPEPPARRQGWGKLALVGLAAGLAGSALTLGATSLMTPTPVVVPTPVASAPANAALTGWADVANKVTPSVVAITVTTTQGGDAGSGVIWDADGHVVTNDHVVSAASTGGRIRVTLSNQHVYDATIVGTDPTTDLAVLQITDPPADLTPIDHTRTQVAVGDDVLAVGNPLGLSGTVTSGIVSAVDRPVATSAQSGTSGQPVVTDAIQTSAAVNPGNSGGALVDAAGTLVGINSSIASLSQSSGSQAGSIGIGFAIPTNEVDLIVPQLISSGVAHHAFLGVSSADATVDADGATKTGAGITQVVAGGPAASVLQAGDVVTAIDGQTVTGTESLVGRVRELPVGQDVMVSYVRGGAVQSAQVMLGQAPQG